jgi:hypothetical protein
MGAKKTSKKAAGKKSKPKAPRTLWAVPHETLNGCFYGFTTEKAAKVQAEGGAPVFGPFFAAERDRQD